MGNYQAGTVRFLRSKTVFFLSPNSVKTPDDHSNMNHSRVLYHTLTVMWQNMIWRQIYGERKQ